MPDVLSSLGQFVDTKQFVFQMENAVSKVAYPREQAGLPAFALLNLSTQRVHKKLEFVVHGGEELITSGTVALTTCVP